MTIADPISGPVASRAAADDAAWCARVVRTHARTFTLASRLLPAESRRAVYALYAFCRVADDLVDHPASACRTAAGQRLAEYEHDLRAALAGRPRSAVFREVVRVVREYGVPPEPLYELLAGVARDLAPCRYTTWADLEAYCQGVAGCVGEMCTWVFGVPDGDDARARAIGYARTLGVAMQLTNILRDIGEDAQRGRCYLPEHDLAMFGLTPHDVLTNPAVARDERWQPMMTFQVARARALYQAAIPGIALLAREARRCARACAAGYAGILGAIEAQRYDTISSRARLGRATRLRLLLQAW